MKFKGANSAKNWACISKQTFGITLAAFCLFLVLILQSMCIFGVKRGLYRKSSREKFWIYIFCISNDIHQLHDSLVQYENICAIYWIKSKFLCKIFVCFCLFFKCVKKNLTKQKIFLWAEIWVNCYEILVSTYYCRLRLILFDDDTKRIEWFSQP